MHEKNLKKKCLCFVYTSPPSDSRFFNYTLFPVDLTFLRSKTVFHDSQLREPGRIESREKDDGHQQQILVNVVLFHSHCRKNKRGLLGRAAAAICIELKSY